VLARILAEGIARHHDDPALIVGDRTCTYADLFRLSHALAGSLSERGIRAGDRTAFLLPNGLEIILCYYACFILGAIAVPLNIRFPPELIAYVLDHSEARILISEPELFAGIAPIRSERRYLETVYLAGDSPAWGVGDFGDLLRADHTPEIDRRSGPDQPAALFYTSGTTGIPKGVIHTHGSLMGAVDNQVAEIGITEKDKTLIVLPICYLVAFGSQVLPFHASGATSVVLPSFEPQKTLSAIHTHRPTVLHQGYETSGCIVHAA
jgi:long-chain acyl-CoA synthetase